MQEILKSIFSEYGLIAGLFTGLLVWVLKQNNDRELRYLNIIDSKISVIEDDVKEIKDIVVK